MREHARRPFDLANELMLRTTLFRIAPEEHMLLFQPHHVAFDAWAVEILYRDLGELYAARARRVAPRSCPSSPVQYRDFAIRQRERLRAQFLDRELDFWRAQLAGAPTVLRLPTDRRRPAMQTFEGATSTLALDAALADAGARALPRPTGVTPYMLLLATFATLLYRRSGQDDILFGGPMANRDHPGFEDLIGFFANTIVVRVRLARQPRVRRAPARACASRCSSPTSTRRCRSSSSSQAVGPERDPGVNPLFQVNFRVRVGPARRARARRRADEPRPRRPRACALRSGARAATCSTTASPPSSTTTPRSSTASTIEQLAADFESLLRQVVADPAMRLLSFELGEDEPQIPDEVRPTAGIRGFRRAQRAVKPASTGITAPVTRAALVRGQPDDRRGHVAGGDERAERMVGERQRLVVRELDAEHRGHAREHRRIEVGVVLDRGRADGVDADRVRRVVERERLGQADHAVLGRDVVGEVGEGDEAGGRGDVDDRSAAARRSCRAAPPWRSARRR